MHTHIVGIVTKARQSTTSWMRPYRNFQSDRFSLAMLRWSGLLSSPRRQKTWCNSGSTKQYNKNEITRLPLDRLLAQKPYIPTKYRRPGYMTRHGNQSYPSGRVVNTGPKYCDMSKLHAQDTAYNGGAPNFNKGVKATEKAMSQDLLRY